MESAAEHLPEARWQRCMVHSYRNVFSHVPATKVREVSHMLKAIHAQESPDAADRKARAIVDDLRAAKMNTAAGAPASSALRWRSPAALQLLGHASAAQRAEDASGLVPHAFVRFLRPEDFLAVGESDSHPVADASRSSSASARTSARKASMRWSIGFPAVPPVSLADSPSPPKAPRRAREGRCSFWCLTACAAAPAAWRCWRQSRRTSSSSERRKKNPKRRNRLGSGGPPI